MAGNETVEISVGEIAAPIKNALVGGPFGSDLGTADYVPSGVPVIRGQNLSNGKFVGGEFVFVTEEKADKLKSNLARPGDLVFTQRGNAVLHGGQVAIVPDKPFERYLVSQSQMKLTPDQTKVESRFLYFVFTSADYRHYLRSNAVVTGVPHINLGLLREYALSLPPLAEQKAIAAVLGALDDKIELNRRMNATLEAMARALFQSWFVDFDPVRAKLDGRSPAALDAATAALFPDHLEESPLGHIPKGWKCGTIGELGVRILDKVGKQSEWASEPLIDLSRMPQRSVALDEWGLGAELTTSVTLFLPKDILFGAIRPYFHKVGIAPVHGVTNVSVFVIRAKQAIDGAFLAVLCSLDSTVEFATRVSKGTKMPVVGWPDFANYPIIVPPLELRSAFGDVVAPLYDRIIANIHQSRTLATLRDTLLPKLLSGELSVKQLQN